MSLWADEWTGCRVILMCDNSAVVDAINKKSMRGITITILQFILLIAVIRDIELHSEWLSSEDNAIADALSRHQFDRLTVLCEQQGFSPILLRNSTHLRNYRRKLLSSYGMGSPPLPERRTSQPSTSTIHSQNLDEQSHFPHRSTFSQHGSRRRLSRQRPKQPFSRTLAPQSVSKKMATSSSNFRPPKYVYTPKKFTPHHSYLLPISQASPQLSLANQFNLTTIWAV